MRFTDRKKNKSFEKFRSLALAIDLVNCVDETNNMIDCIFNRDGVNVIGFANAHAFNLATNNDDFMSALASSDFLLRDGIGVAILLRLMKINPGLNMNGTDYIPKLLGESILRGYRIILLGTAEPFNLNAANLIRESGGDVGLVDHGFCSFEYYLDRIDDSLQDKTIIILAMGMPKQEILAEKIRHKFDSCHKKLIVVNGGAILDFMGGKVKRCPLACRKLHLEWLYRLLLEPKRLTKRYVIGSAVFLYRAICVGILANFNFWKDFEIKKF